MLTLLDAERSQLRVADWAAVAATEPVLAPDGVHLAPTVVTASRTSSPMPSPPLSAERPPR